MTHGRGGRRVSKSIRGKPDIVAIREKVAELNHLFGGKTQIEEWEHNDQGGLRVLITWRYEGLVSEASSL